MARVILPHTRRDAEHAAEVTERLQEDAPLLLDGSDLGLDLREAICPACSLAYWAPSAAHSWGICPECFEDRLVLVED